MERIIKVKLSKDEKVFASPEVNRGDTVIWSFEDNVEDQKLEVRLKGSVSPFGTSPSPNQISGNIPDTLEGNIFEYDIFKNGERLEWEDIRGGCFKPIGG